MICDKALYILTCKNIKGAGKKTLERVIEYHQFNFDKYRLTLSKILRRVITDDEWAIASEKAQFQIDYAINNNDSIITILSSSYPLSLKLMDSPPVVLFCRGNLSLLHTDSIAIIGTRSPTPHGELIAARISSNLSKKKWTITSGLAKGVDVIAHKSCLIENGHTIAVLAHGLDKIYPAENKYIATEILNKNGLLITEYAYFSYTGKSNFIERDRIQAGLSKAVMLVQSDLDGGSMHASKAILQYNRHLLVIQPTSKDIANQEPKIRANTFFANGSKEELSRFTFANAEQIKRIIIIKDRNDLESTMSMLRLIDLPIPPNNASLI